MSDYHCLRQQQWQPAGLLLRSKSQARRRYRAMRCYCRATCRLRIFWSDCKRSSAVISVLSRIGWFWKQPIIYVGMDAEVADRRDRLNCGAADMDMPSWGLMLTSLWRAPRDFRLAGIQLQPVRLIHEDRIRHRCRQKFYPASWRSLQRATEPIDCLAVISVCVIVSDDLVRCMHALFENFTHRTQCRWLRCVSIFAYDSQAPCDASVSVETAFKWSVV